MRIRSTLRSLDTPGGVISDSHVSQFLQQRLLGHPDPGRAVSSRYVSMEVVETRDCATTEQKRNGVGQHPVVSHCVQSAEQRLIIFLGEVGRGRLS